MRLYKKTGCRVFLVGCLKRIPVLQMDRKGEFFATLIIDRKKSAPDDISTYHVFVCGESALRVKQFGFPGLHLWIEGDFQNTGEIMAEKMSFLNFPESGEIDQELKSTSRSELLYQENFQLSFIENNQSALSTLNTIH